MSAIALKDHELIEVNTSIMVVDFISYIVRENLYKDGTREYWTTKGPWVSRCHATKEELKYDINRNGPLANLIEL